MYEMFVKPAKKEFIIRFPENKNLVLNSNGDYVPDNAYWRRRLLAGEIVLGEVILTETKKKKDESK